VRDRNIACFGPSAEAAMLEGSKAFAKDVMAAAGVPTARSSSCVSQPAVEVALDEFGPPYVVKNDGLAAGKGVVVTDDRLMALEHAESCLASGATVLVEEHLDGPEVSLFVITDGTTAVPLLAAQDFKRVGEGDTGRNTGGMGAYTPLPWAPESLVADVMREVAEPTLVEMARRGTPFNGVLYCGLALTSKGLRVVEFNARFGDPEIQAVLALLESPLGELLASAAHGDLADFPELAWRDGAAVNVVVAAEGYPNHPVKGDAVMGLSEAAAEPGVHILHAGTSQQGAQLVASGGRVLSVVGVAADVTNAREAAYRGVDQIHLRGSHFRRDIAAGI
jgi:phosphoribosylamine--glycine ligase